MALSSLSSLASNRINPNINAQLPGWFVHYMIRPYPVIKSDIKTG